MVWPQDSFLFLCQGYWFIFKCAVKWQFVLQLPNSLGLLFHEEESFKWGFMPFL